MERRWVLEGGDDGFPTRLGRTSRPGKILILPSPNLHTHPQESTPSLGYNIVSRNKNLSLVEAKTSNGR